MDPMDGNQYSRKGPKKKIMKDLYANSGPLLESHFGWVAL